MFTKADLARLNSHPCQLRGERRRQSQLHAACLSPPSESTTRDISRPAIVWARSKAFVVGRHRQACLMTLIMVRPPVRRHFADNALTQKGELQDLSDALEALHNGKAVCRVSENRVLTIVQHRRSLAGREALKWPSIST